MKIRALRLFNVRRFQNSGIAIEGVGDGVSVLSAPNEAGKSTCFDMLAALLFHKHSSTVKAINALQPYSKGPIYGEMDLELPEGRFRLAKRFKNRTMARITDLDSGRVIAQADAAEAWITALTPGGLGGPAGLLWVPQGGAALDRAGEDARADILSAVAGEVDAVAGGVRMDAVRRQCLAALDIHVTQPRDPAKSKPKAQGPLKQAIDAHAALAAEEAALSEDLAALHTALEGRRQARRRLEQLDDPAERQHRQSALRDAKAALAAAQSEAQQLETAHVEARFAALKQQEADAGLKRLEALQSSRDGLATAVATRTGALEKLKLASREAGTRSRDAAAAVLAAEAARDAALAGLQAVERAADRRARADQAGDLKARVGDLAARQEKAASVRRALVSARLAAKAALPEDKLKELRGLDRRRAETAAQASAASPRFTMRYHPDATRRVRLDGSVLDDGEACALDAPLTLELEGIGALDLDPGGQAAQDLRDAATRAQAELTGKLTALGLGSMADAESAAADAAAARSRISLAEAQLDALAPQGEDALATQLAEAQAVLAAAAVPPEPDPDTSPTEVNVPEAEAALETATTALLAARTAREVASSTANAARDAESRAAAELEQTSRSLADAEDALGPKEDRAAALSTARATLNAATAEAAWQTEIVAGLGAGLKDLDNLQADLARAQSVLDRNRTEREATERRIAELDGAIQSRKGDGLEERLSETRGRLEAAQRREAAIAAEVAALQMLLMALEDARAASRAAYFQPILTELIPLLRLLFPDAAVVFDDASLWPQMLSRHQQEEAVEGLSGGMREQLALLTRLAFAALQARQGKALPVILDDALVFSDDDRIEAMFTALHRQASAHQVLVLTCRQRAFERLGGQALEMTPWTGPES